MRVLCLLACCGLVAGAVPIVLHEAQHTCDKKVDVMLARAVSQEVLYNSAYEWSKHSKIMNWTFERVAHADTALLPITLASRQLRLDDSRECVLVRYAVRLPTPGFVHGYSAAFSAPVPISKSVCSSAGKVFERTELAGLPMIGNMLVTSESVFAPGHMRSVSSAVLEPSFALSLFHDKLTAAVKQSWRERTSIAVQQLCA